VVSRDVEFRAQKEVNPNAKTVDDTGVMACLSAKTLSDMDIELNIPDDKSRLLTGNVSLLLP
jgi:outer membrane usher protein